MLSFPVIEFFCRDLFGFLNALIQRAVSSLLLLISDHITESLLTSHNSNAFSRTCYCCIKKISVHQHSRTGKQWNDHCRIFWSLWFMYGYCISKFQFIQLQLDELELAYAVTIHKSQGSEYPAVIIPLLSGPRMLMNRNLLYTAVTRARKCVTVVGSEETFRDMIRNEKQQRRYSSLDQRIQETE